MLLPIIVVDVCGHIVVYTVVPSVTVVITGAEDDSAATELAGTDEIVMVLCMVEVMIEIVVTVLVMVLLPEVITVLSTQVVL